MLQSILACLTCSQAPSLTIKSHSYSIERLLGDGGYAYVYLVTRDGTDRKYALKKIRCMFGGESVAAAMREVEACHTFRHSDLVMSCIDSAVVQEADGTKTVYIVLPYYDNGSLQDRINANVVQNTEFTEDEIVKYALGIARALEVMHKHRVVSTAANSRAASRTTSRHASSELPAASRSHSVSAEQDRLLEADDDDGGEESMAMGELLPFAHRDVKPANIMISGKPGNEKPVLIDLGSCSTARINIETRNQALEVQDIAAEHCTLPYRAPELFDVRTGSQIDEKVDIWGLGCTLYALMYSVSPFEREEQVAGANINIAIARGKFSFPDVPSYSTKLKNVVTKCLQVDPALRPSIGAVIDLLHKI